MSDKLIPCKADRADLVVGCLCCVVAETHRLIMSELTITNSPKAASHRRHRFRTCWENYHHKIETLIFSSFSAHISVNLLFRTSNLSDWVSVAQRLQTEYGWNPTYWLAHPELENEVRAGFPDTVFHSKWDARRHINPSIEKETDAIALDKPLLEQFRTYRYTILRLMDRMDPGNAYSYDERVRSYHKYLRYWLCIIKEYDINGAIFARPPHGVAGYTIYAICQEQGIPTPILKPVHQLPKYNLSQDTVDGTNKKLAELCNKEFHTLEPKKVSKPSRKAVEKLTEEYTEPSYVGRKRFPYLSKLSNLLKYPEYARKLLKKAGSHDKQRNKTIEYSEITNARKIIQRQAARLKKRKLRQTYKKRSTKPDLSSRYIYVPLHYQPERTTVPDGDIFGNQYLMIDMLSKTVPDDWRVFVKEHPTQFSPDSIGERSRHTYHYDDLNNLNNVTLINYTSDSFELIDNAKVTATVTGTAGWESVVRGTPSMVFGNAWYRLCPGVHYTTTLDEVQTALENIQKNETISRKDIFRFVRSVEIAGYHGYQSSNWEDADRVSKEKNVRNICSEIYRIISD